MKLLAISMSILLILMVSFILVPAFAQPPGYGPPPWLKTQKQPPEKKAERKPIWLVVTRPIFQEAIKPLEDKRTKDGFRAVISTLPVTEAIATLKYRPAFLLLVGDDQPGEEKQPWYVPSPRRQLYRWRAAQEKEFAADTLLGDFDGDLVPDIPVGRIPVRTVEQLKLVVTKIIAFEQKQPTLDDLRLPIWTGEPGIDPVINRITTALLLDTVETNASEWLRPWIISADPMHSLCGWPPDHCAMFTKQLKRGGLMAVLMGHGSAESFYSIRFNGKQIRYTAAEASKALTAGKPSPAMVIIACSTGNFTGRQNCLAESLLLMPAGPVAVIGATTESHPLPNYFSGLCLLRAHHGNGKRLGSIWLTAQQQMMITRDPTIEQILVDVEGKLEEKMNVAKLRRDQILMYALLGDPATRLHQPDKLDGKIKYSADGWYWDVEKPKGATKLYVSFRPEGQSFPTVVAPLEKTTALKLFHQANDTFAFRPLGEFAVDKDWKGTINEEGTLRLVAVGPGRIYAIAFSSGEEVTVASSADANSVTDPNKPAYMMFEGLEEALKRVDQESEKESRAWTRGLVEKGAAEKRMNLLKAVQEQVVEEFNFLRQLAVEEEAVKTAAAIDGLIAARQKRFEEMTKEMEEARKRLRKREERRGKDRDRTREREPRRRDREDRSRRTGPF